MVNLQAETPFQLLDYFSEGDPSFAGRDEDIEEVVARAAADTPFVLYARSGLGKTSLLLAGVFPKLRPRGLRPIYIRLFESPLLDFRNAVAQEMSLPAAKSADDLLAVIGAASEQSSVVLVFDQFEELFLNTRKTPAARVEFFRKLAEVFGRSALDLRITLSLREDYLAELDEMREFFPDILSNQYRLYPLTAFGARQAITAPLVQAGIPFDQGLVVHLVDLLAKENFDPLLLQVACGEVYREATKRDGPLHLTEADVQGLGGLDKLFERYLSTALGRGLAEGQKVLTRAVLDALITPEETKRAVRVDSLLANDDFRGSKNEIEEILKRLDDQKLVRQELRHGDAWVELRHDRLAPVIVRWFQLDSAFAQFRTARNLIAEAARRAAASDRLEALLSAAQIEEYITPCRDRLTLNDDQRKLMFRSAVYGRLDSVQYWADRFDIERCGAELVKFLQSPSAEARLGAALAAEKIVIEYAGLGETCLKLALGDPDAAVRLAAARALAKVGTPEDADRLRAELRRPRGARRALHALSGLLEAGGKPAPYGRIWRLLAWRLVRRRALAVHRDRITSRGRRGAALGVAAASFTALTLGTLVVALAAWSRGVTAWFSTITIELGVAVLWSALPGLVLGWWTARRTAMAAAVRGVEGSLRSIVSLRAVTVLGLLLVLAVAIDSGWSRWGIQTGIVFGPFIALSVAAAYGTLFRPAFWGPDQPISKRVFFGWALGAPIAALAMLVVIDPTQVRTEVALLVPFISLAPALALSLTETAAASPIGRFTIPSRWSRLLARTFLLVCLVATPAMFVYRYGTASIPLFAPLYDLPKHSKPNDSVQKTSTEVLTNLTPSTPKYFYMRSMDKENTWVEVQASNDTYVESPEGFIREGRLELTGTLVKVPPGNNLMRMSAAGGVPVAEPLKFISVPLLVDGASIELSRDWKPFLVRFQRLEGSQVSSSNLGAAPVLQAKFTATLPLGTFSEGKMVYIYVPDDAGGEELGTMAAIDRAKYTMTDPVPVREARTLWGINYKPTMVGPFASNDYHLRGMPVTSGGAFEADVRLNLKQAPGRSSTEITVPILFALGDRDPVEQVQAGESPMPLLEQQAIWNDPEALQQLSHRLDDLHSKVADDAAQKLRLRAVALRRERLPQPPTATDLNELAWKIVGEGHGADAVKIAREAAAQGKDNPSILDTVAHAEFAAGNWKEAAAGWDGVLRLDPEFYKTHQDSLCEKDLDNLKLARQRAGR